MSTVSATASPVAPKQSTSLQMILVMGGVATVCGLLLILTYQVTQAAIQRNFATIMRDSVSEVLPGAEKQVVFGIQPSGELEVLEGLDSPLPKLFAGYDGQGNLIGVAMEGSAQGYGGTIRAIMSYSPERECIFGFKVLESRETPGLGDKIGADPAFLENFKELAVQLDPDKQRLLHSVTAVKHGAKTEKWQIDSISGATISSRAIGKLLDQSAQKMLPIIAQNLDEIAKGGV
jgi:electron transport complex protein RnfG